MDISLSITNNFIRKFFVWMRRRNRRPALTAVEVAPQNPFKMLPMPVLQSIYSKLCLDDVKNLRMTDKWFENDVKSKVSVRGRLDDCGLIPWKGIKTTKLDSLRVRNYIGWDKILKDPLLLKSLKIVGEIAQRNLKYLLKRCTNLEVLNIQLYRNKQIWPELKANKPLLHLPQSLKELKIGITSYDFYNISSLFDSFQTTNARTLLNKMDENGCPNLRKFSFKSELTYQNKKNLNEHHLIVMNFIKAHKSSLRTIEIGLISTYGAGLDPSHTDLQGLEMLEEIQEDWILDLKLVEVVLDLDYLWTSWKSLLLASKTLEIIKIKTRKDEVFDYIKVKKFLNRIEENCEDSLIELKLCWADFQFINIDRKFKFWSMEMKEDVFPRRSLGLFSSKGRYADSDSEDSAS